MIQIQLLIWLEDEDELKMKMTWRWWGLDDDTDDTEKKTCAEKLCRENTFLAKRECWCNCNFKMYSLVFLIYCNPMFIPAYIWVMSCPDVPIESFYNVNKSCQVNVGNPPIIQGLNSMQFRGPRVVRITYWVIVKSGININREWVSLFITHSLTLNCSA